MEEKTLTNLYLGLLAFFGFDPKGEIEFDGVWGAKGQAAQDRMNYMLDQGKVPELCRFDADDVAAVFGTLYVQALGGNMSHGIALHCHDNDWLRTQRRFNLMVVEGTDPASFTDDGDPDDGQMNEVMDRIRNTMEASDVEDVADVDAAVSEASRESMGSSADGDGTDDDGGDTSDEATGDGDPSESVTTSHVNSDEDVPPHTD